MACFYHYDVTPALRPRPVQLPGDQAVGVVALRPVGLVHDQQLDLAGGKQAAGQVVTHHLHGRLHITSSVCNRHLYPLSCHIPPSK